MKMFVYGTLKKNFSANYLMGDHFIKEAETVPKFTMYDGGFPQVVRGGSTSIKGEVWDVPEELLPRIDMYEGHPTLFERQEIELSSGEVVNTYIYQCDHPEGSREIPEGRWEA